MNGPVSMAMLNYQRGTTQSQLSKDIHKYKSIYIYIYININISR